MCGRFTQGRQADDVAGRFGVQQVLFEPDARYNIAPTQPVPVVVERAMPGDGPARFLEQFQWGLVPSWAKDPSIGSKMINARSETVAEKPSFRNALKYRRCIVPADGFYEWDKAGGTKQPYLFRREDGDSFGFAGLWEEWHAPDGSPLLTCTILTTAANDTVGRVHDRMPVILRTRDEEAQWLDTRIRTGDNLAPLFRPYPDQWMLAVPVSRRVNSPANDAPDLLTPVSLS